MAVGLANGACGPVQSKGGTADNKHDHYAQEAAKFGLFQRERGLASAEAKILDLEEIPGDYLAQCPGPR